MLFIFKDTHTQVRIKSLKRIDHTGDYGNMCVWVSPKKNWSGRNFSVVGKKNRKCKLQKLVDLLNVHINKVNTSKNKNQK